MLGVEAAALSSQRTEKRLMELQIVFNQIPSLPDSKPQSNFKGLGARAMLLNILPANGLSVTN